MSYPHGICEVINAAADKRATQALSPNMQFLFSTSFQKLLRISFTTLLEILQSFQIVFYSL